MCQIIKVSNQRIKNVRYRSLGRPVLRALLRMASPLFPDQSLRAECRLPWCYVFKECRAFDPELAFQVLIYD